MREADKRTLNHRNPRGHRTTNLIPMNSSEGSQLWSSLLPQSTGHFRMGEAILSVCQASLTASSISLCPAMLKGAEKCGHVRHDLEAWIISAGFHHAITPNRIPAPAVGCIWWDTCRRRGISAMAYCVPAMGCLLWAFR